MATRSSSGNRLRWRLPRLAFLIGTCWASNALAQAIDPCDLTQSFPLSPEQREAETRLIVACMERSQRVALRIARQDSRRLGFSAGRSLRIVPRNTNDRIELHQFSSPTLSPLYASELCRKFKEHHARIKRECALRGLEEMVASEIVNMFFMSDPRLVNFDFVPVRLAFEGGQVSELASTMAQRPLVLQSFSIKGTSIGRLDFRRVVILGDLELQDCRIGEAFFEGVLVLGEFRILNCSFDFMSVKEASGLGRVRFHSVSSKEKVYLDRLSFGAAEISQSQLGLTADYELRRLARFAKEGLYMAD